MNEDWHPEEMDISAYLDGELDLEQRERVSSHLQVCPDCREALARLNYVFDQLADLPDAALEADLSRRVQGALDRPDAVEAPAGSPGGPVRRGGLFRVGLGWIAALQAGLTALLLGLFGAQTWQAWKGWTDAFLTLLAQQPVVQYWAAISAGVSSRWLAAVQMMERPLPFDIPSQQAVLIVAASGLTWLIGNHLLLRKPARRIQS